MPTPHEVKDQPRIETPLLLFDCQLRSGEMERWSTHSVNVSGSQYHARVLRYNAFEMRSGTEDGVDGLAKLSILLANADSRFSQIEQQSGFRGARLTISFLFFNLRENIPVSESVVLFRGVANRPDEITESTFRLTFSNRLNLQRVMLPNIRIQRRCPWVFPGTSEQRQEAVTGGSNGKYAALYRCGYSAGEADGAGNLNDGAPFTSCDFTRASCAERGMFDVDQAARPTRRFGGVEFVPPSVSVRSYGEKSNHLSSVVENEAKYNDFVPLVYGTAWCRPPIVFARNDGNLTRAEVLLGAGAIQSILKVVVNNVEIPLGEAGRDMTATGWYNLVSAGGRNGAFNPDFTDGTGRPLGDPYGSMAVMSVVVPNRLSDGRSLPKFDVLMEGLKLPRFDSSGEALGEAFTNNPAWVLLDVLRRSGWGLDEVNLASFARAAEYSDELVEAKDLNGNAVWIPRHQCNLVLRRRRSTADLVRGIRTCAGMMLRLGIDGLLEAVPEDRFAVQQPTKPSGSNAEETLSGGWPAYEFGDGTTSHSGILRRENGESTIRLWSRSAADTPNRYSVEFQDAFNEYQQDSLALGHSSDIQVAGQEVSATLNALGLPNMDQAGRITARHLRRAVDGNLYVDFETSVKALHLRPGDLITLTYQKEGFNRKPFRIATISPALNFGTARITAQAHSDGWYTEGLEGAGPHARRQADFEIGVPRPLVGAAAGPDGEPELQVEEREELNSDGSATIRLAVSFAEPSRPGSSKAGIPLLALTPVIESGSGSLAGGQTLYYAVSAADDMGEESALSFIVRAHLPAEGSDYRVTIQGLSFSTGTSGFHVYRGRTPSQLLRISTNATPAGEFQDNGLPSQTTAPPDANYDHANFYWRLERVPDSQATAFSPTMVGNSGLGMIPNEHRHATVRITAGRGSGQERLIASNDATTLTVSIPWNVTPDGSSYFTVSESGWRFGSSSQSSPAEFEVPNRAGATVQISGRAANVHDQECAYELSPLKRWRIGGSPGGLLEDDVPPLPTFFVYTLGQGRIELSGVAFEDLTGTRTVTSGTLVIHYWDELSSPSTARLGAAIGDSSETIELTEAGNAAAGDLLQTESEVLRVESVQNGGLRYTVSRASHGTSAATHAVLTPVYPLRRKVFIVAFPRDFFGSPASGSFSHSIELPDARVAAAEFFVTNGRGNSATKRKNWTSTADGGLRTLSGGQISFQVEGPLAIETDATPPLIVESDHAVREIFAVVQEAPTGEAVEMRLLQNGSAYCDLIIQPGSTVSNVVHGFGLAPLSAGARLTLDITAVGQGAGATSGRDLTVTISL